MRFVLLILCLEAAILSLLFGVAGRYDLPWCWAMAATHAACMGAYIWAMDPDLRRERLKPGGHEHDGHEHDRWFRLAMIPQVLIHLVVAGLDLRFSWTGSLPPLVHIAGLVILAAALLLAAWAVRTNRFFSSVVRIQNDRGHHVITGGPYTPATWACLPARSAARSPSAPGGRCSPWRRWS